MVDSKSIFGIQYESIPCEEISDPLAFEKLPLVSVFMITYNHEKYIAQAIQGVLQQKINFPFELIIGEDCSTDHTRDIVLEYQSAFPSIIRVLISEQNVGANKNARRVYSACRGKYIAYCEGDDFWHNPYKLDKQVRYLESHPDVGMIHSDGMKHLTNSGESSPRFSKRMKKAIVEADLSDDISKLMLEFKYFVITCSVVTRRVLIEDIYTSCKYEFDSQHLSIDFQTWMELANRSRIKFIDESLVTYNILPESATHTHNIDRKLEFLRYMYDIRMLYINKYGRDNKKRLLGLCIREIFRRMIALGVDYHSPLIVKQAFAFLCTNSRRVHFLDPFHYPELFSIFLYNVVRILFFSRKIFLSLFRHLS